MEKQRILHIAKYYYPFRGGTEQTAQDCVNCLSDLYEQKVICFNHESGDLFDNVDGIEVIRCGCFAKVASQSLSISYMKLLKEVFASFSPDIVIFHYPNPFVATWLLQYIPKKCKLIVYWHLDIVKQRFLRIFFHGQNRRLINRADRIISTSPNYVEGSHWLSPVREKCVIIPSCINEERLQTSVESQKIESYIKEQSRGKIICVAVGRHTEYKGFKYLIRASRLLDDNFIFYLIGRGELTDELKKEAEGDSKIHLLGAVSDSELIAYLSAMDIYCFPSITKNEAFGLALAEGMYFGKPAVTFTIPGSGVNYVCLDGVNGIEVENRNVEKYAKALNDLSENEDLRHEYGEAGRNRVVSNFLYQQYREHIRKVVEEILKS